MNVIIVMAQVLFLCPSCSGNMINEIDELRQLADWVEENFTSRTRPPKEAILLLARIRIAQGK